MPPHSPAWSGFATTSDKQRIEAFVRQGVRLGLYGDSDPTPTQLFEDADESLFKRIRTSGTTSITSCNSSFQTTTATATVFDLDVTSSCPQRQLFTNIY